MAKRNIKSPEARGLKEFPRKINCTVEYVVSDLWPRPVSSALSASPPYQMKQKHVIDAFKGATLPACLGMIVVYGQQENVTMWVYAALHGTYGILWCLKSNIFPDKSWEAEIDLATFVISAVVLSSFWIAPWLLAVNSVCHSPAFLFMCICMCQLGFFLHFVSDMQKFVMLDKKTQLITSLLFERCRNPNYLGELMIYGSFVLLSWHWLPALILGTLFAFIWLSNMRKKDASLSRYQGWNSYVSKSNLIFPQVFTRVEATGENLRSRGKIAQD